jgi:lysophospholipase
LKEREPWACTDKRRATPEFLILDSFYKILDIDERSRLFTIMHSSGLFAFLTLFPFAIVAQNLTESYAPVYVDCPKNVTFVRPASEGLNADEETWIHNRKRVVAGALSTYLSRANLKGFDLDSYIAGLNNSQFDAVPGIGIAISGGGFASAVMGSGVIRALDGRENISNAAGTGGLLQATSFFSGQSGGSWVVSAYAGTGFPLTDALVEYFQPQINRFNATINNTHEAAVQSIFLDVVDKAKAGFNVSIADFMGRLVSYEFVPGPRGGLNATMSGIKDLHAFENHQMPLPIIQITQVTDRDPVQLGIRVPTNSSPIVCILYTSHRSEC